MWFKVILSALLKFSNIGILVAAFILTSLFRVDIVNMLPMAGNYLSAVPVIIYLAAVVMTLMNKDFHTKFNKRQARKKMRNQDIESQRIIYAAMKRLGPEEQKRLRKTHDAKNSILNLYYRGENSNSGSYIKEKIAQQTLNIFVSYVQLIENYCARLRGIEKINISSAVDRVNMNSRKLSFTKDPYIAEDIKKVIQMDEKIIENFKNEKNEVERIITKLQYMESTLEMFKNQMLSNIESEEIIEKIDEAVNEATALDSAMREIRRGKIR